MDVVNFNSALFLSHHIPFKNREDGPTYNVIEVWKQNITGQGVVVAVVDEGFDPDHPEIKDNYVSQTIVKTAP